MSSTFLPLGTGARPVPSGKWTGFYNSHLYHLMLAQVSYSHGSCGVFGPVSSLHFLLMHHTVLCLGWTEMSPHSLSLVLISSRFHLYPWECSWQMGSPWDCDAFCRAHTEGSLWSPALWGALGMGRKGWFFSCEACLTLLWIVRGWPTSAWLGIGLHSSLGENPTPCFISSGKNATSVQKQPKTLYEWKPLNDNISELPKAVNRISGIVEEVLGTYIQTPRLFLQGAALLTMLLGIQAFFWPSVVPLFPENAVQLGEEGKMVQFVTAGLFVGVHPDSWCGASAVVRLCGRIEVPMCLGVIGTWGPLDPTLYCLRESFALAGKDRDCQMFQVFPFFTLSQSLSRK